MPHIKLRKQVERFHFSVVLGAFADERPHKVLELEVEHVEAAGELHGADRGSAVRRVGARHAHQVVERLSGVARVEVALRGIERHARVGVELRGVGGAPEALRHSRSLAGLPELHVCVKRRLQLSCPFQLLRGEHARRHA